MSQKREIPQVTTSEEALGARLPPAFLHGFPESCSSFSRVGRSGAVKVCDEQMPPDWTEHV